MALINQINGNLLRELSGGSSARGSGSPSQLDGRGTGSTVDRSSVDYSSGLSSGAQIFGRSLSRMNMAVSTLQVPIRILEQLQDYGTELYRLAQLAANPVTTPEDRTALNSEFLGTLVRYQDNLDDARLEEENLLSANDLGDLLSEFGINLNAATTLVESFSRFGGADGRGGREQILLADGTMANPLSLSLEDETSAENARVAFKGLLDEIKRDLSVLRTVSGELFDAMRFSAEASRAFQEAGLRTLSERDLEKAATEIVRKIKDRTDDNQLAEHSDLDRSLAAELLGS